MLLFDPTFFSERIVNIWNNLPGRVYFSSLASFVRTVKLADLSSYLRCIFRNEFCTFVGYKCLQYCVQMLEHVVPFCPAHMLICLNR